MVIKFNDIVPIEDVAPRGGKGLADKYPYEVMKGMGLKLKTFNMMVLEENSAIGYHKHTEDMEVYLMLDGVGKYSDNGTEVEVEAGDLMLCEKGSSHSLEAMNNEPITFLAFIAENIE